MKALILICLLSVAAPCSGRKATAPDERGVIEYAKSLDVSRLDEALPSQPLEVWLRRGPARVEPAHWYMSVGCDLKAAGAEPRDGYPLCVRVPFARRKISGWALIRVGTIKAGIDERPHFEYASLTIDKLLQRGQYRRVEKLSQLETTLDEVDEADRRSD